MLDRNVNDDLVKLVRYSIVSIRRGGERLLVGGACKVFVDDMSSEDGVAWLIADYCRQNEVPAADRKDLRVAYRVLGRWPRQSLSFKSKELRRLDGIAAAIRGSSGEPPPGKRAAAAEPAETATAEPAGTAAAEPAEGLGEDVKKLLAALAALGGDAAMGELVQETGESRPRLREQLGRLIDAARVRRAGKGLKTRYYLVEK